MYFFFQSFHVLLQEYKTVSYLIFVSQQNPKGLTQLDNLTATKCLGLSRLSAVVLLSVWELYQLGLLDNL